MKSEGLTEDEIARAKIQLRGNYLLANENVGARMQTIGRTALLGRPLRTQTEDIKYVMSVDRDDVMRIIERVLNEKTLSVIAAGPIDSTDGLFA